MNAIHPVSETSDTVTLARADYEALLDRLEDLADARSWRAFDADRAARGIGEVLSDALPAPLARRLLDGESPIRIWRAHRGLTVPALAARAGLTEAQVQAAEEGATGSLAAIAAALGVEEDDLRVRPAA